MSVPSLFGRILRGLLLALGLSVFVIGILVVFAPETAAHLPMEALIAALGSDYLVVAVVGLATVGLALFAVLIRRVTGVNEVQTPIVEDVQSAMYPGASFDRANGRIYGMWVDRSTRERLRETAIQTLMRAANCSRSQAERRVDEGTWTDDDAVAQLLANAGEGGVRSASFGMPNRARRAVEAIEAVDAAQSERSPRQRDNDQSVRSDFGDTGERRVGNRRTKRGSGTTLSRGD